jgi:predicted acylesterase/phospholipase RssA
MTTNGPTRVAIACQGGGAHTAFTAGALRALLERKEELESSETPFEIVALSGTSGGAVCAALAWCELFVGTGRDMLSDFWLTGYPDGNASLLYLDALIKELTDLGEDGRLPWLPVVDRWRVDLAQSLLRESEFMEFLPVSVPMELRTYYFRRMFASLDKMTPELVKSYLKIIEDLPATVHKMMAFVPGSQLVRTLTEDVISLCPIVDDSVIRRECDILSAFRTVLEKYLTPELRGEIKGKILKAKSKNASFPELLLGAVDALRTHPYEMNVEEPLSAELRRVAEIEKCLEEHPAHGPDRTNFKIFRGSENISRLVDCIAASAAIPTVMRGVAMDNTLYWDGLYSHNPPVHDLPDVHRRDGDNGKEHNPQEIWVIRINPMECDKNLEAFPVIQDRRNELAGNLSLLQEIRSIRHMNGMVKGKRKYAAVAFGFIDMKEDVASELDYLSKLDKRKESAEKLFDHGREQAESFMARWHSCH